MKKIVLVLLMSAGIFWSSLVPLFTTLTRSSVKDDRFFNDEIALLTHKKESSAIFEIREVAVSHVTRNGLKDGALCVVTTECSSEVYYSLDGGVTFQGSPQFIGLAAGTYEVVAQVKDLCVVKTVTIYQPALLDFTTTITHPDCSRGALGSLMIMPTGGIPPFRFSVDKGATFQQSPEFIELTAGIYPLLVEDSRGKRVSHDVQIGSHLPSTGSYLADCAVTMYCKSQRRI
ncbi:hypothetical protein H0X06_03070 [Candidatus Dependentiae bacterium]|nr:hypothetical protein [Candidatus Dependentiae bacterium]